MPTAPRHGTTLRLRAGRSIVSRLDAGTETATNKIVVLRRYRREHRCRIGKAGNVRAVSVCCLDHAHKQLSRSFLARIPLAPHRCLAPCHFRTFRPLDRQELRTGLATVHWPSPWDSGTTLAQGTLLHFAVRLPPPGRDGRHPAEGGRTVSRGASGSSLGR